jgi:hypothetical protein
LSELERMQLLNGRKAANDCWHVRRYALGEDQLNSLAVGGRYRTHECITHRRHVEAETERPASFRVWSSSAIHAGERYVTKRPS